MSNHLSGPDFSPPAGDARVDITDLYVFTSSERDGHTTIALDVNPMVPAMAALEFCPEALYQINIDTTGDAVADVAFNITFSAPHPGQRVTVRRAEGEPAQHLDDSGDVIIDSAEVSLSDDAHVVESGPYRFFAGLRSDPFFADFDGLLNNFTWTGVDAGADKNVLAIVLEAPDGVLSSSPSIGVWARVALRRDGGFVAVDRAGKPAMVNFFSPGDGKTEYNAGEPRFDVDRYTDQFVHVLQEAGGYSQEEAQRMTRELLPDVLLLDRSRPCREPNGRRLDDDSVDARIARMFNGRIPSHGLKPHRDLSARFPYLGTPHPILVQSGA